MNFYFNADHQISDITKISEETFHLLNFYLKYENLVPSSLRKFEKLTFKSRKLKCDIEFLEQYILKDISPKFVKIKMYNEVIQSTNMFQKFKKIF